MIYPVLWSIVGVYAAYRCMSAGKGFSGHLRQMGGLFHFHAFAYEWFCLFIRNLHSIFFKFLTHGNLYVNLFNWTYKVVFFLPRQMGIQLIAEIGVTRDLYKLLLSFSFCDKRFRKMSQQNSCKLCLLYFFLFLSFIDLRFLIVSFLGVLTSINKRYWTISRIYPVIVFRKGNLFVTVFF